MLDLPLSPDWAHPGLSESAGLVMRGATPAQIAGHATGRIVYLATPYADDLDGPANGMSFDLDQSIASGEAAALYARDLAVAGVTALPVAALMAAMIQVDMADRLDPLDRKFWAGWSAPVLRSAGAVVIAPIFGWDRSAEVWAILRLAVGQNTPVFVMGEA